MKPELYDAIKKFHDNLKRFSDMSFEELLLAKDVVSLEYLKAGDSFITPGMNAQKVGIIVSGLCKTYYIMENGKEHISHFAAEGSFIGAYTDMLKRQPASGYVEALEPCTILVMNYDELLACTKNSISWAHLLRKVTEDRYVYRSDKDRQITLKTAIEKYQYFIETHSNLEARLHQNQIALYLNLAPATLSRLKNQTGKYKPKNTES